MYNLPCSTVTSPPVRRYQRGNNFDSLVGYARHMDRCHRVVSFSFAFDCVLRIARFKNEAEFWAYNVVFGLFQAPYYAFSQTMMAELTPEGYENMVPALCNLPSASSNRFFSSSVCLGCPIARLR